MIPRRLIAAFSTVVLVGMMLLGPKARAATDDACALVTQAEVTTALGAPVKAGTYVMPTFKNTCTWKYGTSTESVTLNIMSQTMFDASHKNSFGLLQVVPVSGVGDEAYYVTQGELTKTIARKGSVGIKVEIYSKSLNKDQVEAKEKAIAAIAVGRT
jgi:hypothetical protein